MINIAIVEDSEDLRNSLVEILELSGKVKIKATYSNAEVAIMELPLIPVVDVVIMDLGLPEMSGDEAIKVLKPLMPNSLFLAFTVFDQDKKIWAALNAGATGYLLKTTSAIKLIEAIEDLHSGGAPMSPSVARKLIQVFQNNQLVSNVEKAEPPENHCLTNREYEILGLLATGMLYKEIADKLFISLGTVKQHLSKTYQKLHVKNKVEAINKLSL